MFVVLYVRGFHGRRNTKRETLRTKLNGYLTSTLRSQALPRLVDKGTRFSVDRRIVRLSVRPTWREETHEDHQSIWEGTGKDGIMDPLVLSYFPSFEDLQVKHPDLFRFVKPSSSVTFIETPVGSYCNGGLQRQ